MGDDGVRIVLRFAVNADGNEVALVQSMRPELSPARVRAVADSLDILARLYAIADGVVTPGEQA